MSRWSLFPRTTPRAAFGKLVLNEFRLAWRQPIGLIFGVGLPILLLVIFGTLPKFQTTSKALGGLTRFDVYVPILIAFVVAAVALWSLPGVLATYREQGVLRRLSTTPAPPAWLLAAQVIVNLCLVVAGVFIVIVVSVVAFGIAAPKIPGGIVVAIALSIAALFAIGLWLAAAVRSASAASALGWLTFFPLMFFAGLWEPRQLMPSLLREIGDLTPLGASVRAAQSAFQNGFPPATALLVLAAYAAVFGWLAVRFFRWE